MPWTGSHRGGSGGSSRSGVSKGAIASGGNVGHLGLLVTSGICTLMGCNLIVNWDFEIQRPRKNGAGFSLSPSLSLFRAI